MSKQRTLASAAYDTKGKVARSERFLRELDAVITWATLRALIEPHYTKAGRRRRPLPLETMLRVYFLQQWTLRWLGKLVSAMRSWSRRKNT